jgi:hypothetical protein
LALAQEERAASLKAAAVSSPTRLPSAPAVVPQRKNTGRQMILEYSASDLHVRFAKDSSTALAAKLYSIASGLLPAGTGRKARRRCGSADHLKAALWRLVLNVAPLLRRAAKGATFTGLVVTDGVRVHIGVAFLAGDDDDDDDDDGNDNDGAPKKASRTSSFASPTPPHSGTATGIPQATPDAHRLHLLALLEQFTSSDGRRRQLATSQADDVVYLRRLYYRLQRMSPGAPNYQALVDDVTARLEQFTSGGDPGGTTLVRSVCLPSLDVIVRSRLTPGSGLQAEIVGNWLRGDASLFHTSHPFVRWLCQMTHNLMVPQLHLLVQLSAVDVTRSLCGFVMHACTDCLVLGVRARRVPAAAGNRDRAHLSAAVHGRRARR